MKLKLASGETTEFNRMQEDNLLAFVKLYKKYRDISVENIEKTWAALVKKYSVDGTSPVFDGYGVCQYITGFGSTDTCTLCGAVNYEDSVSCHDCFWYKATTAKCFRGFNGNTYDPIATAKTAIMLRVAIDERAKYMLNVLNNYFHQDTVEELLK